VFDYAVVLTFVFTTIPRRFNRVAVAEEEEQSPAWKGYVSTPGFPGPHVKVFLGRTLNHKLPTDVPIGV